MFRGTMVKVWFAQPVGAQSSDDPGTVIEVKKDSFCIACGERTVLEVSELQAENRRRSPAADFIHGYFIQRGDRFESVNENGKINF